MTHLGVEREDGKQPTPDPIQLLADNRLLLDGFEPIEDVEPALPGRDRRSVSGGLPDFTGLTLAEAMDVAERASLSLDAVGSGIAVMQDEPPGPLPADGTIRVFFEPPN